jgi:hypothetical protein
MMRRCPVGCDSSKVAYFDEDSSDKQVVVDDSGS